MTDCWRDLETDLGPGWDRIQLELGLGRLALQVKVFVEEVVAKVSVPQIQWRFPEYAESP